MFSSRWITIIVIVVLVILAVVYGFIPKPVSVDVIKVSRGSLKVTVEEEGKTRVSDRFVLSAPVAGYMRRIELEVGVPVTKGQKVAELEPLKSQALDPRSRAEAEAAIAAAQAALNSAQENARSSAAEADYAKKKLERSKKLYDEGYISNEMFDQAETQAKQTEANHLAAEAAVKTAGFELEKARAVLLYSAKEEGGDHAGIIPVQSPVSGQVLKIHHESAGVVNPGESLIDIGNLKNMEVKVEVLSADAVKIKPGTPVLFERWGSDAQLTGKVRAIEPAGFTKISSLGVEEQRVLVIVDITSESEKWQRLGDGYSLEASFILWDGQNVLQIPASALFRNKDGWAVFVVENNRAHSRKVERGHSNGLAAEIVSGLTEGEMVIMHPDESIKNGTRIRVR